MKFKSMLTILTVAFLIATILPSDSEARGGGKAGGQGSPGVNKQTQTMEQNRVREQSHNQAGDKQPQSGTTQKKGNTYGPGDGTGNTGVRPQDGTGYGAPANR
jgi:hypothetical protein